ILSHQRPPVAAGALPTVTLWRTPITVQVEAPKTPAATLAAVAVGVPQRGPSFAAHGFHEPMITTDGHLLVARIGQSPLSWHRADGGSAAGTYEIVYAVAPTTAEPCDVTAWSHLAVTS